MTEKNEGIKAAFDELLLLENDDKRRQEYKIREKAIMDYKVQNRAAREEGIREGRKEEKLENAMSMLKSGLSIELISNITKLHIEKIKELQNKVDEKAN